MIANKMELCDRLLARGLGQGQTGRKDICLHEKYDQADTEPRATMASAVRMEATPDKAQYKDENTCDKPAEKGVGTGQFFEHQRNGDEHARADDHRHVQGRRLHQAKLTLQPAVAAAHA